MLYSVRELCRFRIMAADAKLGKAADFYFDDSSWAVKYLVVNSGRWLTGNRVLVPPVYFGHPNTGQRSFPLSLTKQQIAECASTETEQPVSQRNERLIASHYGGPLYRRGGGPMAAVHGVATHQALAMAEPDPVPAAETENGVAGELRSALEVIGYQTEALDGPIGVVGDFLVDSENWEFRYLVIQTGASSSSPRVLVPPAWVQQVSWAESRVHLTVRREKIKKGSRFEPAAHTNTQARKPAPFLWP